VPRPLVFLPLLLVALAAALALGAGRQASAAIEWPQPSLVRVLVGLNQPTVVAHAGDGSGRIFVAERTGRIRIVRNGTIAAAPFLDLSGKITASGSEQGLLGLAFPPGYGSKGHFYVDYTRRGDAATVIARYRLTSADVADPASEQILLTIPQPYPNHNGGQLAFGPRDGYLYVGMGDGGSGGDPQNRAQNPAELLGKLLRLDVESGAAPYAIPPTNPTVGGRRSEIWALGLRNPWRFSFDRETGDLYVGDVGQGAWEEINFQPAASPGGENYGWRITEGTHCYNPATGCSTAGITLPVAEYANAGGTCSVTGGYVYRGDVYPRMRGTYLYGDFCSGQIWALARDGATWQTRQVLDSSQQISTFGEDEAGDLYLADYREGALYRLADAVSSDPCRGQAGAPVRAAARVRLFLPTIPRRDCGV
jgi:glucose/arabinose dehydrogenase